MVLNFKRNAVLDLERAPKSKINKERCEKNLQFCMCKNKPDLFLLGCRCNRMNTNCLPKINSFNIFILAIFCTSIWKEFFLENYLNGNHIILVGNYWSLEGGRLLRRDCMFKYRYFN